MILLKKNEAMLQIHEKSKHLECTASWLNIFSVLVSRLLRTGKVLLLLGNKFYDGHLLLVLVEVVSWPK